MKRGDWEVFLESCIHKNRIMKISVVENLCVALRKGGYRQRWSQALLSLYPFSWIKSEIPGISVASSVMYGCCL